MLRRVGVGDEVSTTLTGTIVRIDYDLGILYLEGCASGGHVPWTYELHWATEFEPAEPKSGGA